MHLIEVNDIFVIYIMTNNDVYLFKMSIYDLFISSRMFSWLKGHTIYMCVYDFNLQSSWAHYEMCTCKEEQVHANFVCFCTTQR